LSNIAHLFTFLASLVTLCVTIWVERKSRKNQEYLKYVEEKVKIYEPIVRNLRYALSSSRKDFDKFQEEVLEDAYYIFWLYASENTLKLFNKFIDTRLSKKKDITFEELEILYKDLFLSIRKDIFPNSKLELKDVRVLVNFNQE
jgi:hypothetical protein